MFVDLTVPSAEHEDRQLRIPAFGLTRSVRGSVSGDSLIGLQHALMLPAMLLVMFWRLSEYTRPHGQLAAQRAS